MKWLLAFCLCCVFVCSCGHSSKLLYKDQIVEVTEASTINYLNVHASHDTVVMKIFGETFKDVRGLEPFYLQIPQMDSILFVTGRTYDNGQATVHIVNLKTKQEIHFPGYDSHIGKNIWSKAKRIDERFEEIESVDGDKVVICAGELDSKFWYYLDLKKEKFEKEEAFFRDFSTGRTNHYTYIGGKSPYR